MGVLVDVESGWEVRHVFWHLTAINRVISIIGQLNPRITVNLSGYVNISKEEYGMILCIEAHKLMKDLVSPGYWYLKVKSLAYEQNIL